MEIGNFSDGFSDGIGLSPSFSEEQAVRANRVYADMKSCFVPNIFYRFYFYIIMIVQR